MPETQHIDTDVLVIGGGLGGCWAAIKAKTLVPRVTLVDKAGISRSGASAWAYYFLAPAPEKELLVWRKELVKKTEYLTDQDWVNVLFEEYGARLAEMESWGVPFERDDRGQLIVKKGRGHENTGFVSSDGKARMEALRNRARDSGVRLVERVMITDLLTSDGRLPTSGSVVGATGFHTRTGQPVVIRSKAVVLATGPIRQESNLTGDGIAIGFRAGAEAMSMEFCTHPTCVLTDGKHFLGNLNILFQSLGVKILNSRGERFMVRYDPILAERSSWTIMALALARERIEGRYPAVLDMSGVKAEDVAYYARLHPGKMRALEDVGIDVLKDRLMVMAQVGVNSSSGDGGLRIDTSGRTSIPGLYGAGTACKNQIDGMDNVGGTNLAFCSISGYRAGENAARYSIETGGVPLDERQVHDLQEATFGPLKARSGLLPSALQPVVNQAVNPAMVSLIKRADRLKKTVAELENLETATLPEIRCRDYHELAVAHELKNFSLVSKLAFRSALERQESRHSHYRQDYPFKDEVNWLKWVLVRRESDGRMRVRTEPVPFERYPEQPGERRVIPSPVVFERPTGEFQEYFQP
ncbi:MAG: FAD-binding protein [Chloroflexi bacterium]|nr:FAD-binding protein [Chloroflexota bacterium]